MKHLTPIACVAFSSVVIVAFTPSPSGLVLREKVNGVAVADSASAPGSPIGDGTAIVGTKFIRTGADARAQVDAFGAVVRVGANSLLQVSDETGDLKLVHGSALFDRLASKRALAVQLSDHHQAFVSGDTGFAVFNPSAEEGDLPPLVVGSVAGTSQVQVDGSTYFLKPGDVLAVSSSGKASASRFDLMQQIKTSVLLTGFKASLPSAAAIDREAKNFAALQRRGFVRDASEINPNRSGARQSGNSTSGETAGQANSSRALGSIERTGITAQNGVQKDALQTFIGSVSYSSHSMMKVHGNTGVGNGEDPSPPGNPPINPGPGTGPGHPGNKGGKPGNGNGNANGNP